MSNGTPRHRSAQSGDPSLSALPTGLFGGRDQATQAWSRVVNCLNAAVSLTTAFVLFLCVVPAVLEIRKGVEEDRRALVEREAASLSQEKALEDGKRHVVNLQAAAIAQQERIKALNEENRRLAEELNRTLKGGK